MYGPRTAAQHPPGAPPLERLDAWQARCAADAKRKPLRLQWEEMLTGVQREWQQQWW